MSISYFDILIYSCAPVQVTGGFHTWGFTQEMLHYKFSIADLKVI